MPHESEAETERLHEAIKKELDHEGGSFLRQIALTTAFLAGLASLAALRAGGTVNDALVLKTEAARLQSEASDQWAYYQAKGIKAAVQEVSRTSWLAIDKEPPVDYEEKQKQYVLEQKRFSRKPGHWKCAAMKNPARRITCFTSTIGSLIQLRSFKWR